MQDASFITAVRQSATTARERFERNREGRRISNSDISGTILTSIANVLQLQIRRTGGSILVAQGASSQISDSVFIPPGNVPNILTTAGQTKLNAQMNIQNAQMNSGLLDTIANINAPQYGWTSFIIGDTDDKSYSYSISSDNNKVYITGFFSGTLKLYNGNVYNTTTEQPIITLKGITNTINTFLACYNSSSGKVLWATAFGNINGYVSQGMSITDGPDGVYVTGPFASNLTFYNSIQNGELNITSQYTIPIATLTSDAIAQYVVKYNVNGQLDWVTKIDKIAYISVISERKSQSFTIRYDIYDGIYVSGFFVNNTTIYNAGYIQEGSLAYEISATTPDIKRMFLVKFNRETGQFMWATATDGDTSNYNIISTGLACNKNQTCIAGFYNDTIIGANIQSYPKIYFCDTTIGKTSGTALTKLNPSISTSPNGVIVLMYSSDGQFLWTSNIINTNIDESTIVNIQNMTMDMNENLYVTVMYRTQIRVYSGGSNNIGPQPPTLDTILHATQDGFSNCAIIKYNKTGEIQWIQQINNMRSNIIDPFIGASLSENDQLLSTVDITSDANNNIYLIASYNNDTTSDFEIYPSITNKLPSGTKRILNNVLPLQTNAILIKLNTNGELQWINIIGGNENDYGMGISVTNNNLYITGIGKNTVQFFDPIQDGITPKVTATITPGTNNNDYIYTAKYNTDGKIILNV